MFRDVHSNTVMQTILEIHFPKDSKILDLTYGKGAFYRELNLDVIGFDLNPRYGAVVAADSRHVPVRDKSVDVVILDGPFQHGISKTSTLKQQEDYTRMKNQWEIHQLMIDTAPEMRRVARVGAIVKCMNIVEAGRYIPTEALFVAAAKKYLGYPEDMAILDSGVVRPTNHERILHLRQAHSFFLVYKWTSRPPRSPLA